MTKIGHFQHLLQMFEKNIFLAVFWRLGQVWLLGGVCKCFMGLQYSVYLVYLSKTRDMLNMMIGNLVVYEKPQHEEK